MIEKLFKKCVCDALRVSAASSDEDFRLVDLLTTKQNEAVRNLRQTLARRSIATDFAAWAKSINGIDTVSALCASIENNQKDRSGLIQEFVDGQKTDKKSLLRKHIRVGTYMLFLEQLLRSTSASAVVCFSYTHLRETPARALKNLAQHLLEDEYVKKWMKQESWFSTCIEEYGKGQKFANGEHICISALRQSKKRGAVEQNLGPSRQKRLLTSPNSVDQNGTDDGSQHSSSATEVAGISREVRIDHPVECDSQISTSIPYSQGMIAKRQEYIDSNEQNCHSRGSGQSTCDTQPIMDPFSDSGSTGSSPQPQGLHIESPKEGMKDAAAATRYTVLGHIMTCDGGETTSEDDGGYRHPGFEAYDYTNACNIDMLSHYTDARDNYALNYDYTNAFNINAVIGYDYTDTFDISEVDGWSN